MPQGFRRRRHQGSVDEACRCSERRGCKRRPDGARVVGGKKDGISRELTSLALQHFSRVEVVEELFDARPRLFRGGVARDQTEMTGLDRLEVHFG